MKTLTVRKPVEQLKKPNWMKWGAALCLGLAAGVALATRLEK